MTGSVWYKLAKSESLSSCSLLNPLGVGEVAGSWSDDDGPREVRLFWGKVSFCRRDAGRNKVWDLALMKWSRGYCTKRQLKKGLHIPGRGGLVLWVQGAGQEPQRGQGEGQGGKETHGERC